MNGKASILLVGGGSVGAIAALNLEAGREADVTVVCRSSYHTVKSQGYTVRSCDHGHLENWHPSDVVNAVPSTDRNGNPFDYIVCATKNIADALPPLTEILRPAVAEKSIIVLIQNGLNIEKPFFATYPTTPVLSGVSLIGVNEPQPAAIQQDFPDTLYIGAFHNPALDPQVEEAAAKDFVRRYSAGGKTHCEHSPDVGYTRWRKLVYNATLNPISALTSLDTGRLRLAPGALDGLVRPAMREIVAAARAVGYELPDTIVEDQIEVDPLELYLPPSMLQDVRKGGLIEFETIVGEPLREGERAGVGMPTVRVLYELCRAVQWRTMEEKGLVKVPEKET